MKVFVDKKSIEESIKYFEFNTINKPEQLGLFFFFKSLGISVSEYISFNKVSQMSEEEKNLYNNKLYTLSSVFAPNEVGEKRTCLFPFSIQKNIKQAQFYNGGSAFKNLLSRITDTIDNTLVDKFLDKNSDDKIKLKRNYLRYIKETYLKGNKISLINLSVWVCKFIGFEVDNEIKKEEFTRLCVKYTIQFLNLNESELQELFFDDSLNKLIEYTCEMVKGESIRSLISFTDNPEVIKLSELNIDEQVFIVSLNESRRIIEMSGNNPSFEEIKKLLKLRKQIILYGVPGVGKSRFISDVESDFNDRTKIQFHPSTTYEEFIGGTTIENGTVTTKAGKFLEKCIEAKNNPEKNYLFVIDEINRGNISKIFGETILALDREYKVNLIKPIKLGNDYVVEFKIPENMYIIATMNSADRSIAVIDYAIRRRFGFIKLQPNYEVVKEMSNINNIGINIEKLFKVINNKIQEVLGEEELLLGQSYFLPNFVEKIDGKINWTSETLRLVFNYSIVPIIEEYTYGNKNDLIAILGEKIASRINDNDEFLDEIKRIFPEVN
ncbi:AAA family ATPase [Clostridium perfringens]|nr:AAA family ATPase [Clostridium perfringens]